MRKKILAIGITFLFIVLILTPLTNGYNIDTNASSEKGNILMQNGVPKTLTTQKNAIIKSSQTNILLTGSIQDLIDSASPGDTVYVPSGVYHENVIIDKAIILIGEDKNTTIIDGMRQYFPLWIKASSVSISGFTIKNSPFTAFSAGIYVRKIPDGFLTDIYISDCIIEENDCGIKLVRTQNANVSNCIIRYNEGHSIYVLGSVQVKIQQCEIFENGYLVEAGAWFSGGIVIASDADHNHSEEVEVSNCNIYRNIGDGLLITHSSSSTIYHNNFLENKRNAYDFCIGNNWCNDSLGEGNYWDDCIKLDRDRDGIGDIPYIIFPYANGNKDMYPLMGPWPDTHNRSQNRHSSASQQQVFLLLEQLLTLFPMLNRLLNFLKSS